jgi:hypothetical protein
MNSSSGASIIRRPEAVDTEWMSRVLHSAGIDSTVSSAEANQVGTGQVGECVRFRLEYLGDAPRGPRSLIGKFPSRNPDSFRAGVAQGDYSREVKFYRDLAAGALVSTPKCYLAELDEESGEFVLLLEDLSPARQGDQLQGVSLDQARLVVDEAAKLHASHWNDAAIEQLDWVRLTPRSPYPLPAADSIQRVCDAFCHRYAGRLSTHATMACRHYAERVDRYRVLPRKHRCLTHYDLRPDNVMFANAPGIRPVTIVDWQTLSYAPGGDDLAYFLAGALQPEQRRAHELEFLERYLGGLKSLGVRGYETSDLQRDYAVGGFRLLATAMGGAMAVKQTERGDRMFVHMVNSAAEHIQDHQALALLD